MFATPLAEETTEKIHRFIFATLQEQVGEFIKGQGN